MKLIFKILIIFFIIFCRISAQNSDIYGEAIIQNISRISPDTVQFEIAIKRLNDNWHYFANSTFHLGFDTTLFTFDNSNFIIKRDSSGLTTGILTGNNNPLMGYTFSEQLLTNKIVLGFLGPETIQESQFFNLNQEFIIGKYTIYSSDGRWVPVELQWKNPTSYYQALAYKIESDSLKNQITLYHKNDNLDMNNGTSRITLFKQSYVPFHDTIILADFNVKYVGQKLLDLSWATKEELNVVGFTIKRAFKYSDALNPKDLDYKVIYTWRKDSVKQYHPEMLSKGNSKFGFQYGVLPDSVDYRGKEYCYQLFCSFYDSLKVRVDYDYFLKEECIKIPNAVIEVARIIKNDFPKDIEMEYILSDDCLMTVSVYDLMGKEIEKLKDENSQLLDKFPVKKGAHPLKFHPNPSISSGSYYVYLIAYPIEDNSVEISKATIKLMNLK